MTVPPVPPLTETSALAPPFFAGSMVIVSLVHGVDAVKDQGGQVAVAPVDRRLDDAVVEGPECAVIGDGHGGVDVRFGDRRQRLGGLEHRYGQGQGKKDRGKQAARPSREKCFHGGIGWGFHGCALTSAA
jgi:hypothetical protein